MAIIEKGNVMTSASRGPVPIDLYGQHLCPAADDRTIGPDSPEWRTCTCFSDTDKLAFTMMDRANLWHAAAARWHQHSYRMWMLALVLALLNGGFAIYNMGITFGWWA